MTDLISGLITADNTFELYVDGSKIDIPSNERNDWIELSHIAIESGLCVIAVEAEDFGPPAGIIAKFSNGIVTNSTWKCTGKYEVGWHTKSYDDRHWPAAVVYGTNMDSPWGPIGDHLENAKWIWTARHVKNTWIIDKHVFCRKHVSWTHERCGKQSK